ncbi:unnamed protein product [Calicophoron daubneyi]|uniref:Uncharacterized protein n=1 Tax=Calicophoron daubneyi TaxID=300641 RepID=A0AAV2TWJ3_CALDB
MRSDGACCFEVSDPVLECDWRKGKTAKGKLVCPKWQTQGYRSLDDAGIRNLAAQPDRRIPETMSNSDSPEDFSNEALSILEAYLNIDSAKRYGHVVACATALRHSQDNSRLISSAGAGGIKMNVDSYFKSLSLKDGTRKNSHEKNGREQSSAARLSHTLISKKAKLNPVDTLEPAIVHNSLSTIEFVLHSLPPADSTLAPVVVSGELEDKIQPKTATVLEAKSQKPAATSSVCSPGMVTGGGDVGVNGDVRDDPLYGRNDSVSTLGSVDPQLTRFLSVPPDSSPRQLQQQQQQQQQSGENGLLEVCTTANEVPVIRSRSWGCNVEQSSSLIRPIQIGPGLDVVPQVSCRRRESVNSAPEQARRWIRRTRFRPKTFARKWFRFGARPVKEVKEFNHSTKGNGEDVVDSAQPPDELTDRHGAKESPVLFPDRSIRGNIKHQKSVLEALTRLIPRPFRNRSDEPTLCVSGSFDQCSHKPLFHNLRRRLRKQKTSGLHSTLRTVQSGRDEAPLDMEYDVRHCSENSYLSDADLAALRKPDLETVNSASLDNSVPPAVHPSNSASLQSPPEQRTETPSDSSLVTQEAIIKPREWPTTTATINQSAEAVTHLFEEVIQTAEGIRLRESTDHAWRSVSDGRSSKDFSADVQMVTQDKSSSSSPDSPSALCAISGGSQSAEMQSDENHFANLPSPAATTPPISQLTADQQDYPYAEYIAAMIDVIGQKLMEQISERDLDSRFQELEAAALRLKAATKRSKPTRRERFYSLGEEALNSRDIGPLLNGENESSGEEPLRIKDVRQNDRPSSGGAFVRGSQTPANDLGQTGDRKQTGFQTSKRSGSMFVSSGCEFKSHDSTASLERTDLKHSFLAQVKRLENRNKLDIQADLLSRLAGHRHYPSFESDMLKLLGRKPSWHKVAILYYLARCTIRMLMEQNLKRLNQMHSSCEQSQIEISGRTSEAPYTDEYYSNFTTSNCNSSAVDCGLRDEITSEIGHCKASVGRIKDFTVRFFTRWYRTWVSERGGWQSVMDETEESDLD